MHDNLATTSSSRLGSLAIVWAAVLACLFAPRNAALDQQSICASVKIEILQELTLERQAFEGRMTINNGLAGVALGNISADIAFADKNGNSVRSTSNPNDLGAKFYIRLQDGSSIPSTIPGGSSAKMTWLIIPTKGAAGQNPQGELYFVGATLHYKAAGENQDVPVAPDSIRVKPLPDLNLDYFLPSDVYGDDPFTENFVEPVVPFDLGVRVKNSGYGTARKLKIESAQPKIIANKLGLLVDFRIDGSEVNGRPATPSLLADFGDIDPNRSGVARWIMISTLSGRFVEFTANFTHADELGGELTSLISGQPQTHLLIRDVLVDLPGRDVVRDFLAKDGDVLRVYESENADTLVADLSGNASLTRTNEGWYILSTAPSSGFSYIKLSDPQGGRQALRSATRADGKALNPANAWLSQTWDSPAQHWNYYVSIFDVNNKAGQPYALQYQPLPGQTNRPPKLDPINNWTINLGDRLGFPITASDPDGNQLTFRLLSSPTNSTLDATTGFFQWRPSRTQAGTNLFTVQVTDDGTPPLSDTNGFVVTVSPEGFLLAIGSTNIFSGESNAVPIVLKSDIPLTNVSWVLAVPREGGLTNFEMKAVGPEVFGYKLTPLGSNYYSLNLEVDAFRVQFSTRQLALLAFQSVLVAHSSIVPLPATNLLGRDITGKSITNGSANSGRVFVFAKEPILDANADGIVMIYGRPGGSYAVESRSDLSQNSDWEHLFRLPLTNRWATFIAPPMGDLSFFRAYEFEADPPILELNRGSGAAQSLLLYGKPGSRYVLQSTANLSTPAVWLPKFDIVLTNSFRLWDAANTGERARFFQVRPE